jgi:hypothetical protein
MTARPRCAWILLLLLAQEAAYPVVRPDDRFLEGYAAAVLDLRFGLKDLKPPGRDAPPRSGPAERPGPPSRGYGAGSHRRLAAALHPALFLCGGRLPAPNFP